VKGKGDNYETLDQKTTGRGARPTLSGEDVQAPVCRLLSEPQGAGKREVIMRHKVFTHTVKAVWVRERRGRFYRTHFLAQTTGPWSENNGCPYMVIGSSIPGAVAKLANLLRHGNIGRLHPDGERSADAVIGLNRWWPTKG